MRKPRRVSAASGGARRMASRSARTAGARSSTIAARQTVRRAGVPQGLLGHQRHLVCLPQDAAADYLAAIAIFCNEVKGKSALALSRDLDVQYKTAFVLAHKLRETMATELRGMKLGGTGRTVEV